MAFLTFVLVKKYVHTYVPCELVAACMYSIKAVMLTIHQDMLQTFIREGHDNKFSTAYRREVDG